MHGDTELNWGQVLMAREHAGCCCARPWWTAVPISGRRHSGQVKGLIHDLPSCAELIEEIVAEAGRCLDRLTAVQTA